MVDAVADTTAGRATVLGLVDRDDPSRLAYQAQTGVGCTVLAGARDTLSALTNRAARRPIAQRFEYLASLGDDHVPLTQDWDLDMIEAIRAMPGPGWAYGDDGFQGERCPTAWVQSRVLADELGWMMLPCCAHMFVDNAVLELGRASRRLAYLPDVKIEHQHFVAGKATLDQTYADTNHAAQYGRDGSAFATWRMHRLAEDCRTVTALRY
jgi:hypothetical protein